ncbi:MAG: hypothetical protein GW911_35610, partial [Armatimonadetes bacterium]|nr:hypothetical protein [Armatimonadota bacterium]
VPFVQLRAQVTGFAPLVVGAAAARPAAAGRTVKGGPASSLVIDVRGLGARPCLFPALVTEDRRLLWDSAPTTPSPGGGPRLLWVADPRSALVPAAARKAPPIRPVRVEPGSDCVAVISRAAAARFDNLLVSAGGSACVVFVVEPPLPQPSR